MFCDKCGREVEDGAKYCDFCGNRLVDDSDKPDQSDTLFDNQSEEAPAREGKAEKKNKYLIPLIIGAVALLAIIAIIAFVARGGDDKNKASEETDVQQTESTAEDFNDKETDDYSDEDIDEEQSDGEYSVYGDGDYHTLYFDCDDENGSFDPIIVQNGSEFQLPSEKPELEGYKFKGWYIERLSDEKYYCKEVFDWIEWDEESAYEHTPYLYEPGMKLVFDNSWMKNGESNSNYYLISVWD